MPEPVTHDLSVALYRYMCKNIVGTEEHVRTLRMMNTVRDNLQSNEGWTMITSGSLGEGLQLRGSDLDVMRVFTFIEVCENRNIHFNPCTTYFTMETEDTSPGFTKLRLVYSNVRCVFEYCDEIGSDFYVPNSSYTERYLSTALPTVHGPCVSDEHGIFDIAYCLHSKSWITSAMQWITRSNYSWPAYDLKQSIVKHGVLFVPIGAKGSSEEELEWRISFSVGEKLLIYTFTHTQLLCYALLKILLKDVIAIDSDGTGLLCSYIIKTVIFWISEESYTSIWIPENLISCFMRCFRRLIYCVENSVCPHYFIPKNNLFENKIKGHVQKMLLNKLYILYSNGWQCILFSDQITNFDALAHATSNEPSCLYVRSITALIYSNIYYAENFPWINYLILNKGIRKVLSIKGSKIKSLYTYYMSKLFCRSDQVLPLDDKFDNKSFYKQYNIALSTLLLGTRHDAVFGWLLLASFFYNTKEYKKSIDILQYCLLKCTPEKLYQGRNLSHIHQELFDLCILREMTTVQMLKFLHLGIVIFPTNSLPNELRIAGKYNMRITPPVVYVHFLRCLCHYHLYNTEQFRDSLRCLQLTLENSYFIADVVEKASSYNMLGIVFQLSGDTESAEQAFARSLQMLQ